ncbi:MAG: hypothetical protein EPN91_05560 [Salinibacterium sp.]|nr:MAG: hypothetical protein EPN91_05560 [Salinibacterium sp.]
MSEMIEHVAQALEARCAADLAVEAESIDWREMARAAIEAMREPTDAMLLQIRGVLLTWDSRDRPQIEESDAREAWQDAIDEALK